MESLNWGLSTHLFVYQPLSAEALDTIKDMGIQQIELWGMRPHFDYMDAQTVTRLKADLAQRGMRVYAVHAPFYAHVEQLKQGREISLCADNPAQREQSRQHIGMVMELLPQLGAKTLILHVGGLHDEFSSPRIELFKESGLKLLPQLERLDLKLALENIATPLSALSNLIALVREINSPRVGLCLDIGHANLQGRPGEAIERCAGSLLAVHLSDNDGQSDQHLVPGEGNIPWPEVIRRLDKIGFNGPLTLELRQYGDWAVTKEKIVKCLKYKF